MRSRSIPSVSVTCAANGGSANVNTLGMRPMQERAYERRGEQDLLIKSPSAPGKTRPGTKIDIEFRIFRFHLHKRVDLQWP
jgi:hypothetical protein